MASSPRRRSKGGVPTKDLVSRAIAKVQASRERTASEGSVGYTISSSDLTERTSPRRLPKLKVSTTSDAVEVENDARSPFQLVKPRGSPSSISSPAHHSEADEESDQENAPTPKTRPSKKLTPKEAASAFRKNRELRKQGSRSSICSTPDSTTSSSVFSVDSETLAVVGRCIDALKSPSQLRHDDQPPKSPIRSSQKGQGDDVDAAIKMSSAIESDIRVTSDTLAKISAFIDKVASPSPANRRAQRAESPSSQFGKPPISPRKDSRNTFSQPGSNGKPPTSPRKNNKQGSSPFKRDDVSEASEMRDAEESSKKEEDSVRDSECGEIADIREIPVAVTKKQLAMERKQDSQEQICVYNNSLDLSFMKVPSKTAMRNATERINYLLIPQSPSRIDTTSLLSRPKQEAQEDTGASKQHSKHQHGHFAAMVELKSPKRNGGVLDRITEDPGSAATSRKAKSSSKAQPDDASKSGRSLVSMDPPESDTSVSLHSRAQDPPADEDDNHWVAFQGDEGGDSLGNNVKKGRNSGMSAQPDSSVSKDSDHFLEQRARSWAEFQMSNNVDVANTALLMSAPDDPVCMMRGDFLPEEPEVDASQEEDAVIKQDPPTEIRQSLLRTKRDPPENAPIDSNDPPDIFGTPLKLQLEPLDEFHLLQSHSSSSFNNKLVDQDDQLNQTDSVASGNAGKPIHVEDFDFQGAIHRIISDHDVVDLTEVFSDEFLESKLWKDHIAAGSTAKFDMTDEAMFDLFVNPEASVWLKNAALANASMHPEPSTTQNDYEPTNKEQEEDKVYIKNNCSETTAEGLEEDSKSALSVDTTTPTKCSKPCQSKNPPLDASVRQTPNKGRDADGTRSMTESPDTVPDQARGNKERDNFIMSDYPHNESHVSVAASDPPAKASVTEAKFDFKKDLGGSIHSVEYPDKTCSSTSSSNNDEPSVMTTEGHKTADEGSICFEHLLPADSSYSSMRSGKVCAPITEEQFDTVSAFASLLPTESEINSSPLKRQDSKCTQVSLNKPLLPLDSVSSERTTESDSTDQVAVYVLPAQTDESGDKPKIVTPTSSTARNTTLESLDMTRRDTGLSLIQLTLDEVMNFVDSENFEAEPDVSKERIQQLALLDRASTMAPVLAGHSLGEQEEGKACAAHVTASKSQIDPPSSEEELVESQSKITVGEEIQIRCAEAEKLAEPMKTIFVTNTACGDDVTLQYSSDDENPTNAPKPNDDTDDGIDIATSAATDETTPKVAAIPIEPLPTESQQYSSSLVLDVEASTIDENEKWLQSIKKGNVSTQVYDVHGLSAAGLQVQTDSPIDQSSPSSHKRVKSFDEHTKALQGLAESQAQIDAQSIQNTDSVLTTHFVEDKNSLDKAQYNDVVNMQKGYIDFEKSTELCQLPETTTIPDVPESEARMDSQAVKTQGTGSHQECIAGVSEENTVPVVEDKTSFPGFDAECIDDEYSGVLQDLAESQLQLDTKSIQGSIADDNLSLDFAIEECSEPAQNEAQSRQQVETVALSRFDDSCDSPKQNKDTGATILAEVIVGHSAQDDVTLLQFDTQDSVKEQILTSCSDDPGSADHDSVAASPEEPVEPDKATDTDNTTELLEQDATCEMPSSQEDGCVVFDQCKPQSDGLTAEVSLSAVPLPPKRSETAWESSDIDFVLSEEEAWMISKVSYESVKSTKSNAKDIQDHTSMQPSTDLVLVETESQDMEADKGSFQENSISSLRNVSSESNKAQGATDEQAEGVKTSHSLEEDQPNAWTTNDLLVETEADFFEHAAESQADGSPRKHRHKHFESIEEVDESQNISAYFSRMASLKKGGHLPNLDMEVLTSLPEGTEENEDCNGIEVDLDVGFVEKSLDPMLVNKGDSWDNGSHCTGINDRYVAASASEGCGSAIGESLADENSKLLNDELFSMESSFVKPQSSSRTSFIPSSQASSTMHHTLSCDDSAVSSLENASSLEEQMDQNGEVSEDHRQLPSGNASSRQWLRKSTRSVASVRIKTQTSWLSRTTSGLQSKLSFVAAETPKTRAINSVSAVKNLQQNTKLRRHRAAHGLNQVWKLSYKERTKDHPGYFDVDVYSLFDSSAVMGNHSHSLDPAPWEARDVKQRFLHEQSIGLSKNWFGNLQKKRGNIRVKETVAHPKSMEMPMENSLRPEEWTEEWYTTWKSPDDRTNPEDYSSTGSYTDESYTAGSFTGSERVSNSMSSSQAESSYQPKQRVGSVYGDRFSFSFTPNSTSGLETDNDEDDYWEDPPECGELINTKPKINERITRIHHNYTSHLRHSRWRRKYFPRGTFPYDK